MEAFHSSVLKSVKVECMEEIGAGLMQRDSSNDVEDIETENIREG